MAKKQKEKRQSLGRILRNNIVLFAKVCKYTPELVVLSFLIEGVFLGVNNAVYGVFTLNLFNALDRGDALEDIVKIIGLMALWYLIYFIIERAYHRMIKPNLHHKLDYHIHTELFMKTKEIDVACYDDPEFYNDFVWAMDEASSRSLKILADLNTLAARIIALVTILGTLIAADIDMIVIYVVCGMGVVGCVVNYFGNKTGYKHEKEKKPLARKRDYFNRVYHLPDYAKEIRTGNIGDLLLREADANSEERKKLERKYGIRYFLIYGIFYNVFMEAVRLGIIFYLLLRMLDGAVLVGVFAASVGLIWRVEWNITDFVERVAKFPEHSLFLEKYYGFLEYKPKVVSGDADVPEFESLELRNVSFTYDFSDKPKYEWHKSDHKKPKNENSGSADAQIGRAHV